MACVATSLPVAVYTSPQTPDKHGSSLVFTTRDKLARFVFIRQTRTLRGSQQVAISSNQMQSAGYSKPPMADKHGTKCYSSPTPLGRWMLSYNPDNQTSFMHGCRNLNGSPGPSSVDQEKAVFTRALTAANTSHASQRDCPMN